MHQTPESLAKKGVGRKREEFHWKHLGLPLACERMSQFAAAWEGTPYMAGSRVRGAGVDCAQLIPAFLDFMYSNPSKTPLPRLAPDTGVHNPVAAKETVKAIRRAYPSHPVKDGSIEPGDIILTRSTHDFTGPENAGHAMIAMPVPGTALHSMPQSGVCITSVEATRGIVQVYRLERKHLWAL